MTAVDNTTQKKLKIKIISRGIRDESEEKPCKNFMKLVLSDGHKHRVTGDGNKNSEINVLVKPSAPANHHKRRPDTSLDGQREKRRRMDHSVKQQCGSILKVLMNHTSGKTFNEPVDPVKLDIPDYFSIIAKPMDLGTIKHKLDDNRYFDVEEFVADVRLTFSNAMLYNPYWHWAHSSAKQLDGIFSMRWKLLEAKLKRESKNADQASVFKAVEKNASRQTLEKNRPMSLEEKRNLRLELVELSNRKMTENLRAVIQKFGLSGLKEERFDSFIDEANDDTLWKLRRALKNFLDTKAIKVAPAKFTKNGCPLQGKSFQKGTEMHSRRAVTSAYHKQSTVSTATRCSSCGSLTCHCRLKISSARASSSDISSERSSGPNLCSDSKLDCEARYPLASHTSRIGPDSNGPGSALNEEKSPHLSTSATTAASGEGWTSFDIQLSPEKALRAAMLKSRFADTIFRATHQKLLDHGDKSDSLRMQQERERLEREQFEVKARIEAEIKAAEMASRKMRREKERETARMALQKMRKTVEINENLEILKDMEEIFCCGSPSEGEGSEGDLSSGNPLERLGLYIKDDYSCSIEDEDEDEDEILNGEDGEILS